MSGVADSLVALHVVRKDEDQPAQVFVPYQTIFRVEIDPCSDRRPKRLGFVLSPGSAPLTLGTPTTARAEGPSA